MNGHDAGKISTTEPIKRIGKFFFKLISIYGIYIYIYGQVLANNYPSNPVLIGLYYIASCTCYK